MYGDTALRTPFVIKFSSARHTKIVAFVHKIFPMFAHEKVGAFLYCVVFKTRPLATRVSILLFLLSVDWNRSDDVMEGMDGTRLLLLGVSCNFGSMGGGVMDWGGVTIRSSLSLNSVSTWFWLSREVAGESPPSPSTIIYREAITKVI